MSYGSDLEDSRESEGMRKMFVGGLNRETPDDVFFNYFSNFGTLVDKVVIKDPISKQSRGFGFITYDRSDCVEAVFQSRPHELDGKTLDVKRAMPREFNTNSAHAKVTRLFVGGVSAELTPEELQSYIESRHPTTIGTVDKIDFLKDKESGRNKGYGFLECSDSDFADRLTISECSFMLNGKSMSLKKAEPKEGGSTAGRGGRGGRGGGMRGGNRGGGYGQGNNYGSGSYGQQNGYSQQAGYNYYSTGYPSYNGNPSTGNIYGQQQQQPQENYGGGYNQPAGYSYGSYGNQQQQQQSQQQGQNRFGGNRYQPY